MCSPSRSEFVAELEADVNGGFIAADAVGEEVLMEFGRQVVVDLVRDVVVDLEGAVEFDRGLVVSLRGGLVVVAELEVDGVLLESLVVDLGAVLVAGEVCDDLGKVLPAHNVPLGAEGDRVVSLLWERSVHGGPGISLLAAVVRGESLDLVATLHHFTTDTSFPLVSLQDDVSLKIEGLILARFVRHIDFSIDEGASTAEIPSLELFARVDDVLVFREGPGPLQSHVGLVAIGVVEVGAHSFDELGAIELVGSFEVLEAGQGEAGQFHLGF